MNPAIPAVAVRRRSFSPTGNFSIAWVHFWLARRGRTSRIFIKTYPSDIFRPRIAGHRAIGGDIYTVICVIKMYPADRFGPSPAGKIVGDTSSDFFYIKMTCHKNRDEHYENRGN